MDSIAHLTTLTQARKALAHLHSLPAADRKALEDFQRAANTPAFRTVGDLLASMSTPTVRARPAETSPIDLVTPHEWALTETPQRQAVEPGVIEHMSNPAPASSTETSVAVSDESSHDLLRRIAESSESLLAIQRDSAAEQSWWNRRNYRVYVIAAILTAAGVVGAYAAAKGWISNP